MSTATLERPRRKLRLVQDGKRAKSLDLCGDELGNMTARQLFNRAGREVNGFTGVMIGSTAVALDDPIGPAVEEIAAGVGTPEGDSTVLTEIVVVPAEDITAG